jgi:DNA-binding GntR family transcriptional regulator
MTQSLSEMAYRSIKRLIVTLELPPGAVLEESDLQARLNIGRTPIREAIQRLARDQFVLVRPRRGVFVTDVIVTELAMLFETRSVIEPYAASLAADRGHQQHWLEMEAVLGTSTMTSTSDGLLALDRRCHEIMWSAAGNRFLTDTLEMLYSQSERVWHLYLSSVADMGGALAEHHEVMLALKVGDGKSASRLMAEHVGSFHNEIKGHLASVA